MDDFLYGLGQGMQGFWNAYQGAKTAAEDKAFKNKQLELQEAARKAEIDKALREQQKQAQDTEKDRVKLLMDQADKGLIPQYDQTGKIVGYKMQNNGMKAIENQLKTLNLASKVKEMNEAQLQGQIPGYDATNASATTKERAEFRDMLAAQKTMEKLGNDLAALVEKHGTEGYGPVAAQMDRIYSKMLTTQKEIERLGALSGPDLGLSKAIVGESPTSLAANMSSNPIGQMFGAMQPKDYIENFRTTGQRAKDVIDKRAEALGLIPSSLQTKQAAPLQKTGLSNEQREALKASIRGQNGSIR